VSVCVCLDDDDGMTETALPCKRCLSIYHVTLEYCTVQVEMQYHHTYVLPAWRVTFFFTG